LMKTEGAEEPAIAISKTSLSEDIIIYNNIKMS